MSQAQLKFKKEGDLDYGSWRSIAAGTLQGRKSFLEKDTPFNETIDGLLGLMPVGARNVTYVPAEAVEELSKMTNPKDSDLYTLKGVPRATAERIRFGVAAPPPALPLRVRFSRPHEWANALALAVDAESEVRLRQAIAACASGLEGLPPRGKAGAKPWTQRYGHAYEAGN